MLAQSEHRRTPSARLAQGGGTTTIINLKAIRREAGTRWDKLRDTIYARLEALLRLRLAPTDFFLPIDEVSYLVSMPKTNAEDAQVCCLRIAYELHSSLLGPCSISQLQIAKAFTVGDDLLEVTPVALHRLIQLAERAGILDLLVAKSRSGTSTAFAPCISRTVAQAVTVNPRYQFQPVWDVQKEVIWAYGCEQLSPPPTLTPDTPSVRAGEAMRQSQATLYRAAVSLEEHLTRGERFLLNVPISYETLSAPIARMEFISACRQLPCELRPYLVFEISNMPVGVPHSRLIDMVGTLKPFSRGVMAQVPVHAPQQSAYEGSGLIGLGFSLPAVPTAFPALDTERLCAVTKRLGISTFLYNVVTPDVLQWAIKSGVHWLSGPIISAPLDEPRPMSRLSKETVLQNVLAAPALRASGQSW
jgi:hypothetical protein